jgi:putative hydrolase
MNIVIDTHTHSVASGHAYSTIDDLARAARKRRLEGFVLTDHGPAMPGAACPYHFSNLRILPEKIEDVFFFRGLEANIVDMEGGIDLEPVYCRRLDFIMAGFHEACFKPRSMEENTQALCAALANPWVDAISHPGNPAFPIHIETVVKTAAEYGKALEINNSSFRIRPGSEVNCLLIAQFGKQYGCYLSCGSDAHYRADVGNFGKALSLLQQTAVPEELVINSSLDRFRAFTETRKAGRPPAKGKKF